MRGCRESTAVLQKSNAALLKQGDNRQIRRRKIVVAKFAHQRPLNGHVLVRAWLGTARGNRAQKGDQLDLATLVTMRHRRQSLAHLDSAAEFLLDFPHQSRRRFLTGLDFASRKLPLQREMLSGRPLGEEDPPVTNDDCADDRDGLGLLHV